MAGESAGDVVNDFESWARLSARLHGRDEAYAEALLHRLGVASVWDNADATWAKTLANEMLEMRMSRVRRYAELVAEELRERAKERADAPEGDFRQRLIYGSPNQSRPPRAVQHPSGTPFRSDLERQSTRRMHAVDSRHLPDETAPTESLSAQTAPTGSSPAAAGSQPGDSSQLGGGSQPGASQPGAEPNGDDG